MSPRELPVYSWTCPLIARRPRGGAVTAAVLGAVGATLLMSGCSEPEPPPEPPPAPEEPPCPEDELLDGALCVPAACGQGDWGWLSQIDPPEPVAWVASWGDDGNEGTPEEPLLSMAAALVQIRSSQGGEIRVAAGDYPSALQGLSDADFSVRGRCRELTTLRTIGPGDAAITLRGGEVRVRDVTVRGLQEWPGGSGYGLVGYDDDYDWATSLVLRRVAVEDIFDTPVWVDGDADLLAEDVIIRRIRPSGLPGAVGIAINHGARATLRDVLVEDVLGVGISISDESQADLERVVVREPQAISLEGPQGGLVLVSGSVVEGRDVDISGCRGGCVNVIDPGSILRLDDSRIADSTNVFGAGTSFGVLARDGGHFIGTDVRFEGLEGAAAAAVEAPSLVELEDSLVLDTRQGEGAEGTAVTVFGLWGGRVELRRTRLERNQGFGIVAEGPGSSFDLREVQIVEQLSGGLTIDGASSSLRVTDGAFGSLDTVEVLRGQGAGLTVAGEGARVEGTGLLCSGLVLDPAVEMSRAVEVGLGGEAMLVDLRVEHQVDVGMFVSGEGSTVELIGAVFSTVRARPSGAFGFGVRVQEGGRLWAEDLLVESVHTGAVLASDPGTAVELIRPDLSGVADNAQMGVGTAVGATAGAIVDVDAPRVSDIVGPCFYVESGGSLSVSGGSCERAEFAAGAVVQGGTLDLDGLSVGELTPSPGEGGVVGVFQWSVDGSPCFVTARNIDFPTLVGPIAYARGLGSLRLEGNSVEGSGTAGGMPGGVFLTGGMGPWDEFGPTPSGVLVRDNVFGSMPDEAILLDGTSGTFEGNTFTALGGPPIHWQRCSALDPLQGSDALNVSCAPSARDLGPLLELNFLLADVAATP